MTTPTTTEREGASRASRSERWAFLLVPFVLMVVVSFCSTADDPLITLRYAANLVHGHGPVFNTGDRVEGFSSPLHLLLVSCLQLLPGGLSLLKAKLLSLLFGVLTVAEAGRLIEDLDFPRWADLLASSLIGGSWILAFASSNGLETTLECWLVTMIVRRVMADRHTRSWAVSAAIAALLTLTRPEAVGLVGMLAIAGATRGVGSVRNRLRWTVGPALALGGSTVGRLWYYRSILPNTYYAKHVPWPRALHSGLDYLVRSLLPGFGKVDGPTAAVSDMLTMLLIALIALGVRAAWRDRTRPVSVAAVVGAQVAFILLSGGDWMPASRFLAPVMPEVIVLEVAGVMALLADPAVARIRAKGIPVVIGLACLVGVLPLRNVRAPVWNARGHFGVHGLMAANGYGFASAWLTGARLLDCAQRGDLVAYSEMGYAGWTRPDLRFLDTRGLVTRSVARRTPRSLKQTSGVEDNGWMRASSPVGSVILEERPSFVISIDLKPVAAPLDGAYLRVQTLVSPGRLHVPLSLYRRADRPCTAVPAVTGA